MRNRLNPKARNPRTVIRSRIRWMTALVLGLLASIAVVSISSAATKAPDAHAAGMLSGTATASLHLVKPNGSELIEEGRVTGVLTGTARAQMHAGGSEFRGTFTIRTRSGSISGRGTATPHGPGRYQSFSGIFTATGGTGRYAHIHGRSGLYGTFDRRSDAVVVQTQGTLTY
jgi:hypothetical protein